MTVFPKCLKSIVFLLIHSFKNCSKATRAIAAVLILLHFQVYSQTDPTGSGRALRFDGIDDYVDLGNIYDNVALPVTISVWIYVEPAVGFQVYPIIDSQDNSSLYNGFALNAYSTPHTAVTYGDGRGGNNPAFRKARSGYFQYMTGRWVNLTGIMRSDTDMEVYLNGHNISGSYEGSSSDPMNSNSPTEVAKIGKVFSNGITVHFKGIMDELRIWNKSLTETEIREQMCRKLTGNEPGLIGYWNFDETSGNILTDKSPNHFNGQLMGNPTWVFSGAPVGDQSVYMYTTNWSAKTLSMSDGADKIEVSGITSNPYGVHIYEVKNVPSQTDGLPSGVTQPYFGVFTANDNTNTTFDIQYLVDGQVACDLFSRNDNSIAAWTEENSTSDFLSRREFIKGSITPEVSVDLGSDQLSCSVSSQELAPVSDPTGLQFTWQDGSTQPTFTVSDFGLYWVKVKNACGTITDSIRFTKISENMTADLGEDQEGCSVQPRILTPVADPTGLEFTWQNGSKQSVFAVSDFGLYWVTVKGACTSVRDSIRFTYVPEEITVDLGEDQEGCPVKRQILNPVANPSGLEFTWQNGSKEPAFTVSDFGVYWVTVKGACTTVTDSIRFSKMILKADSIPNVITPNGDQLNDHFIIDKSLSGVLSIKIVNRWGREVYSAKHYSNNWGGEGLSTGIYFYVLSGTCLDAKGVIHLLK